MNITGVNNFTAAFDCRSAITPKRVQSQPGGFADALLAAKHDSVVVSTNQNSETLDTPIDFTNMTRSELIAAAQQLRSEGQLTGDEAGVLQGFACAYAAAPGEELPLEYSLEDTTKYNFFDDRLARTGNLP